MGCKLYILDEPSGQAFAREDVNRPSIILADDDNALLESVQKLVELEFRVVARANDGQKFARPSAQ